METTQLFKLSPQQFAQIISAQLDVNLVCLFEYYLQGIDPLQYTTSSKVKAWRETLIRKGYLTEKDEVTVQGKEFYQSIVSATGEGREIVKKLKEQIEDDFTRWWAIFPGTDGFTTGNKVFKQTRTLRINKDGCREKFNKMVNAGEYTADQIIKATEMDIQTRKAASLSANANKLSFLNNSYTYLNQKIFDACVELVNKGVQAPTVGPGRSTFTL